MRHAHVLVVEVPGHWQTRAAVERGVIEHGWHLAESPADADVLAVCGSPGPTMAGLLDVVWGQLPGPRVRVDVVVQSGVPDALRQARALLLDSAHHVEDGASRPTATPQSDDDHGAMDHGAMDHGAMAPNGIALAEGGEDRDGLEMDVLQVRLGPILPYWPAGLVLRCSLQGDVIVDAVADVIDVADVADVVDAPSPPGSPDGAIWAARRCDNAGALLALAGWADAAAQARSVRDAVLSGSDVDDAVSHLVRLHRRVARSRLLRWSLRALRPLAEADLEEYGLPAHVRGDARHRLLAMLVRARQALTDPSEPGAHADVSLARIPYLVTGLDLATARLVVASLDLDALRTDRETAHG